MKDMVEVRRPSKNRFAQEPRVGIGRSQFDRSHGLKTTFDASYLVPILVDEVLPGDTFTMKLNGFARIFSPLDAPVMDNISLETFFFFVPTRLLWDNWEAFNGAHDAAGAQDTDFTIPIVANGFVADHDGVPGGIPLMLAYMGIPEALATTTMPINALPFTAYYRIYSEWFRDQNLIAEVLMPTTDAARTLPAAAIRKSGKRHDYFTSALPYLQKGDPVSVALAGNAPIIGMGALDQSPSGSGGTTVYETDGTAGTTYVDWWTSTELAMEEDVTNAGFPAIYADLSGVTGVSINALREAIAIQRLLEKDARGGTRYTEIIKSHFGVTSPDFRLQRSEYLGGGKSFINVSPVANTSDTAGAEQGELSGIGTGVIQGHSWAKSFTEHGYIIGIIRARADLTYFQGLDKLWTRSTRYDFYLPSLANLGEQSILNKEIFISNSASTDNAVFGYQERWAEYRFKRSMLTATFNPEIAGSLSHWHLAEDFASIPSLNQAFIEDATPMVRIVTITTEHDFLLDLWFDYKCARPMPVHSIPNLIGQHF